MVTRVALILLLSMCFDAASLVAVAKKSRTGEFRGYTAVNQLIETRLFQASSQHTAFSIGPYFGDYSNEANGLGALLGSYSGTGANNQFRNGKPNAVNMLLWQIAMAGLAADIGRSCVMQQYDRMPVGERPYSARMQTALCSACTWPAPTATSREQMLSLWLTIMGYDAPASEFSEWHDFFVGTASPYANADAPTAVTAMLQAIFMNPYFLLQH